MQNVTLETTNAHRSFADLQDYTESAVGMKLDEMFREGEVRKTLLSTAQVRVQVVLPFGVNVEAETRFEVTFMNNGKPRTVTTEFASEVAPILSQVYESLASEAVTLLPA